MNTYRFGGGGGWQDSYDYGDDDCDVEKHNTCIICIYNWHKKYDRHSSSYQWYFIRSEERFKPHFKLSSKTHSHIKNCA